MGPRDLEESETNNRSTRQSAQVLPTFLRATCTHLRSSDIFSDQDARRLLERVKHESEWGHTILLTEELRYEKQIVGTTVGEIPMSH